MWTIAPNTWRASYAEALRRYTGPATIVLCDVAYANLAFDPNPLAHPEGLQLAPDAFSVHLLNRPQTSECEMFRFEEQVKQVRQETEAKKVKP